LYDLKTDPEESMNLIQDPKYNKIVREMEDKLYAMLGEEGGMFIPLNQPKGASSNKRYRTRRGDQAADFPSQMVVDKPINRNAN